MSVRWRWAAPALAALLVAPLAVATVARGTTGDSPLCAGSTVPTTTTTTATTIAPTTTTTALTPTVETTTTTRRPTTTTTRPTSTTALPARPVERLAGGDRYATAAAVSAARFAPLVSNVYIATGEQFADALAAAPAAVASGSPVLLVDHDAVPAPTAAELDRLRPRRITVLGGAAAVADTVLDRLEVFSTGPVTRVAGADRYATAAAVAAAAFPRGGPVAFVATGEAFPDALAAGAAGGCAGGPLLLATATELPAATAAELQRLHPPRVFLLGAPSTLSAKLEAAVATFSGGTVDRLAGVDRYATAAAVSAAAFGPGVSEAWIATGDRFPDALAAGAAAGRARAPVLLVPSGTTPAAVIDEVHRLLPAKLVVLGGTGAVADAAVTPLR